MCWEEQGEREKGPLEVGHRAGAGPLLSHPPSCSATLRAAALARNLSIAKSSERSNFLTSSSCRTDGLLGMFAYLNLWNL